MFHHRCLRGSLTYLWLLMTFRNTLISISWCIATFSCWYFINCCMALVIMTMETSVKIYFEIDELKSDKQLRLRQRCFPVNFAKFLRTLFLQNTSWRLLLVLQKLWMVTWVRCVRQKLTFSHGKKVSKLWKVYFFSEDGRKV